MLTFFTDVFNEINVFNGFNWLLSFSFWNVNRQSELYLKRVIIKLSTDEIGNKSVLTFREKHSKVDPLKDTSTFYFLYKLMLFYFK